MTTKLQKAYEERQKKKEEKRKKRLLNPDATFTIHPRVRVSVFGLRVVK